MAHVARYVADIKRRDRARYTECARATYKTALRHSTSPVFSLTFSRFALIQISSGGTAAKGLKERAGSREDEERIAGVRSAELAARRTVVADTSSDRIESSSSAIDRFSFRAGGIKRTMIHRSRTGRGHRRWLSETPRPHDQCHGAFIVLQQKGAHQSTGISSRLISRSHPLVLTRFPSLRGSGILVHDLHPPRTTIAVGLVSHRATTSGGRKGERRSPISHLVDTFIQNALITPSSTPPAAPCVSPRSAPLAPFSPRSRRPGINEFEHDNANFCYRLRVTDIRSFPEKIKSSENSRRFSAEKTSKRHWPRSRTERLGGRPGGLKITSALGGNDSVSPRHGALKYERYDEPRLPYPAVALRPPLPTVISFPDGALALISAL
ncbi:hypothetical protein ALC57_02579 [Trachymyrmex cornetzi]|uniref:Uncharacterized protein n=1 Tax=Trachymyrmex cornetzi TaxID=471704 RepID=A0A151JNX6_9HYME|nr:hypothetical protein ALC57_02579 [Trachymyrmex cornetzi]